MPALARDRYFEIWGTKIKSEADLFADLSLGRHLPDTMTTEQILKTIKEYYLYHGYSLIEIYVIEDTETDLKLFIDEGMIQKIVFRKLDDFQLIRVKMIFNLPENIFSIPAIEANLDKLRKAGFNDVNYILVPILDYSKSPFQIDRNFFGKNKLPFFDDYSPRYDLLILVSKKSMLSVGVESADKTEKSGEIDPEQKYKKNKVGFKLKVHLYRGFIPMLDYYHHNLMQQGDLFSIGGQAGVMYGLNGVFNKPPLFTYFHGGVDYFLKPVGTYFTPWFTAMVDWTRNARPDIGILKYEYWEFNGFFSPGITIYQKFKLYLRAGEEITAFVRGSVDHDPINELKYHDKLYPVPVFKRTDYFTMLGFHFRFEMIPIRLGNPINRNILLTYTFFFPEKKILKNAFHEIHLKADFDFELDNRSIYSLDLLYNFKFTKPPFHHNISVNSSSFKGLGSYFTNHIFSVSNEYRILIYRDYLYLGLFIDLTTFEGLGYAVKGWHFAFLSGPTLRFLILDHYDLYFHYGVGYIVTRKKMFHGYNLGFFRRW